MQTPPAEPASAAPVPPQPQRRRWVRLLGAVGLGAALATAGCGTLDEQQRRWIFQPSNQAWNGGFGAEGLQDVWIDVPAAGAPRDPVAPARLHGLWLPQDDPTAPLLLYLHGARWDVRGSANRMRRMHALGFSVLGIDYRGFGQSSPGLPSEASAHEDALAAWAWLARQRPQARRYVFGHSLGGAIAVNLAAHTEDEAGLIVEGTFTSIRDVVGTMPWGWLPVGPLITQRFDAAARIARVGSPVLVVHGSEDRVIAPELGRALFERAAEPKRFLLVEGGSHHNTNGLAQPLVRQALSDLFGWPGR